MEAQCEMCSGHLQCLIRKVVTRIEIVCLESYKFHAFDLKKKFIIAFVQILCFTTDSTMFAGQRQLAIPLVGAAALLGTVGFFRSGEPKSREEQADIRRKAKQEQGIMGAGVGANASSGPYETGQPGSMVQSPQEDPTRKVHTTAPKEKLPSGGTGGGLASDRAVDLPMIMKNSSQKDQPQNDKGGWMDSFKGGSSSEKKPSGQSNDRSVSQGLQAVFGTGGPTAGEKGADNSEVHNTKGISYTGRETPSKRKDGSEKNLGG